MSEERADERHLILVKHALPTVLPGIPPARWTLSDEGRASCAALAERLRPHHPALIAASDEPKAAETAHLLASALGHTAPILTDHDLREHERRPEDFFASTADFHDAVRRLFAHPEDPVFGTETATAAGARFAAAVRRLVDASPRGDIVIVAHGTVISIFVAAHAGIEPFSLWRSLGLPSYVVLALPGLEYVGTWPGVDGT